MTDASTRIWAWPHFDGWITGDWSANTYHDDRTVEYIRASEHDRIVAKKDARIAVMRKALMAFEQHEASHFMGPDAEKNRRQSYRGVKRVVRTALKGDDNG